MRLPEAPKLPDYQIVQYLGRGANSTIWQVRERRTRGAYALKRVRRRSREDDPTVAQVLNEAKIAAKLDHPVVRKVHRVLRKRRWTRLREIYLLMEFCEGHTLEEKRPESLSEVLRVFAAVARGLAHMHERGLVHADTKPNNIIVGPNGTVKLIDFGQSCPLGTVKLRIQGTPDFIAPEQVHRRPLDARTDVFNWGAALYWTATGRAIPTTLPARGEVLLRGSRAAGPLDKLRPDVPAPLSKLVADCIETQPSRRPASLSELGSRLTLIARTAQNGST